MSFEKRTVIVTGAAKGMGRAIAEGFYREGASVVLLDVDAEGAALAESFGPRGLFVQCDVSRGPEVRDAFAAGVRRFGGVDILVNNAGIMRYGNVTETSEEEWDQVLTVNLKSAFLCAKEVIPLLLERGRGVIINIASVQSFISQARAAAYTTSKSALLGLTRSIAIDYAPTLRCVAVCPGTVDTPMLHWAAELSSDPQAVLRKCDQMHLMQRIAQPEEIAELVLYLASDKAAFITGQPIRIDGGLGIAIPGSQCGMKITDIRATTVTVPLEAPLRHANGVHWERFVRTIVEVQTDEGITGLGEMGGGGESSEAAITGLKRYLVGHDPLQLEAMFWKICNPTASLYNNRMQLHAALEFACIDIAGKKLGIRACDLLGGALREEIPFASYLFYRYPNEQATAGGEETAEEIVAHAKDLASRYGFTTHKLKGGIFPPDHDIEVFRDLSRAFPNHRVRLDPNAAWSVEEAIRVGRAIEDLPNDYYEDPCWGMEGMRRLRRFVRIPTATNTIVVNFEQLAAAVRTEAIDVVLLDTTFWGGLRQAWKAGIVCEKFQIGVAVHSSGELGIQLATMLHLGAALPNQSFAGDAHYHHLTDDIIQGGKMTYRNGCISVPRGPGLGVEIDREKLQQYAELYKQLGGYPYDRDPQRPDWFSITPERRFAVPKRR